MTSIRTIAFGGLASVALLALFAGTGIAPVATAATVCKTDSKPDEIKPAEAQRLYDCVAAQMVKGYAKARGLAGVPDYRTWKLVSSAPLVSATHGRMFVNHWVNAKGADLYTKWEEMEGAKFAVGTIFAKESFRITKTGSVKLGPLFLMEKVAADKAKDGWVYTRLFTNGKFQRTNGPGHKKMRFCHDCHASTIEDYDGAFFPPEEYRIKTGK